MIRACRQCGDRAGTGSGILCSRAPGGLAGPHSWTDVAEPIDVDRVAGEVARLRDVVERPGFLVESAFVGSVRLATSEALWRVSVSVNDTHRWAPAFESEATAIAFREAATAALDRAA